MCGPDFNLIRDSKGTTKWTWILVLGCLAAALLFLLLPSQPREQEPAQSTALQQENSSPGSAAENGTLESPVLSEIPSDLPSKDLQEEEIPTGTAPEKVTHESLKGRWLRPDGGYLLEITSVDDSGRVKAAYYNPRPINVASARATQDGGTVGLFIELRDTGYPGSYYDLLYDAKNDQLMGVYFQATQRSTYQVLFVRKQ